VTGLEVVLGLVMAVGLAATIIPYFPGMAAFLMIVIWATAVLVI
jgi:hypothetical protein